MNAEQFSASGGSGAGGSYGSVAAWVNVTVSAGTPTLVNSAGVTSITDNGAGLFTLNFNYTLPHDDYAIMGSARSNDTSHLAVAVRQAVAPTTSAVAITTVRYDNTITDPLMFSVAVVL